ncbi:hypothetical protein ACNKHM_26920 [Shigella sonnei]
MASRLPAGRQPPAFRINSGPFCPLPLCEFIRLLRQRVQALLIRNLVAKCSQLAFVLQRLIFMREQGFLLCRQLGDVAPPPPVPRTDSPPSTNPGAAGSFSLLLRHASPSVRSSA